MTAPIKFRKSLVILVGIAFVAGVLSGCEPAPSTPLAPDQKPPDVSKMSKEQVDGMLKENGPKSRN